MDIIAASSITDQNVNFVGISVHATTIGFFPLRRLAATETTTPTELLLSHQGGLLLLTH